MDNNISQNNLQEYLQSEISKITTATEGLEQNIGTEQAKKLANSVEELKSLFK